MLYIYTTAFLCDAIQAAFKQVEATLRDCSFFTFDIFCDEFIIQNFIQLLHFF